MDVASTLSLADSKRVLKPTGIYVIIGHDHYGAVGGLFGSLPHFIWLQLRAIFDRQLRRPTMAEPPKAEVMAELKDLLETGKLTPIIDRVFPLAEAGAAMRRLQDGDALGKIILAP